MELLLKILVTVVWAIPFIWLGRLIERRLKVSGIRRKYAKKRVWITAEHLNSGSYGLTLWSVQDSQGNPLSPSFPTWEDAEQYAIINGYHIIQ